MPLETRNASSYLLAFDNTNGLVLGVAVENVSAQAAIIPVVIRDDNGARDQAPGAAISLAGNGHTSFVLSTQFPVTADKRGTIEFDTPPAGRSACWASASRRPTMRSRRFRRWPMSEPAAEASRTSLRRRRLANHFRAGQYGNQRGASHSQFLRRSNRRSAVAAALVSAIRQRHHDT